MNPPSTKRKERMWREASNSRIEQKTPSVLQQVLCMQNHRRTRTRIDQYISAATPVSRILSLIYTHLEYRLRKERRRFCPKGTTREFRIRGAAPARCPTTWPNAEEYEMYFGIREVSHSLMRSRWMTYAKRQSMHPDNDDSASDEEGMGVRLQGRKVCSS